MPLFDKLLDRFVELSNALHIVVPHGVYKTLLDVVLQKSLTRAVHCASHGGKLHENLTAIAVILDHAANGLDVACDVRKPVDERFLFLFLSSCTSPFLKVLLFISKQKTLKPRNVTRGDMELQKRICLVNTGFTKRPVGGFQKAPAIPFVVTRMVSGKVKLLKTELFRFVPAV